MCISVFIIYFLKLEKNRESIFYFKVIIKLIVSFLCAFLIYEAVVKLFFSSSSYLTDQISWGSASLRTCFINIAEGCYRVVIGYSYFRNFLYPIIGMAVGIYLLVYLLQCIKTHSFLKKGNAYYILSGYMFLISPVFLTIMTGSVMANRSQLTSPYVVAFSVIYFINILENKSGKMEKFLKTAIFVMAIYFAYDQTAVMQQFFYTDDVREKTDEMTALRIADDISEVSGSKEDSYPVIFIGRREAELNKSCTELEDSYLGKSVFEFDFYAPPYYYHSTYRILRFFASLGMEYAYPTSEQVAEAREESKDMPLWPQEGSVAVKDGKIIVKLSEDDCLEMED
jgi:hypothetical protein